MAAGAKGAQAAGPAESFAFLVLGHPPPLLRHLQISSRPWLTPILALQDVCPPLG